MRIRQEEESDCAAVRAVNEAAFDTHAEANLVEALQAKRIQLVSLVADEDGQIVGHILFSPVLLENDPGLSLMGLGPMAVMPQRQRQGIGSALVKAGLERCKEYAYVAAVVVGHPDYYPRFGFIPATRYALQCEYDVPADVFMVAELQAGALMGRSGLVRYDEAFANV